MGITNLHLDDRSLSSDWDHWDISSKQSLQKRGAVSLTDAMNMSTVQPFGFLQRGFLHLPVSVRGLRRSKLTLQVSSPGRPNKDNAMRLISPRCSSCTKRLISTTQKKWIQYIRHNIVSTFLSPSSCCQCPC